MRHFHRKPLLSACLAGLIASIPLATAHAAQPPEEEKPKADTAEEEGEKDPDADAPDDAAKPPPDEDKPPEGAWGVGGTEETGKYRPRGKTGKLKELEEEDEEDRERVEAPAELPPAGHAMLDTVIGFGSMVAVVQEGATKVTPTASFVIGVGYRIGDTWEIFARFPISTNESDGPRERSGDRRDPDNYKQIATGALELGVRPRFAVTRDVAIPAFLSLTFPTAMGDLFADPDNLAKRGQAIVNQAAAASRGFYDKAIFAYKRFGIIPGVGVVWKTELGPGKIELKADTKAEIMIKTGGLEPASEAEGELRSTTVNWVIGGGAAYHAFEDYLNAGLKTWVSVSVAPEVRQSLDPGGAVWVFEPFVGTTVPFIESKAVGMNAEVGGILPAVGELAGNNPYSAKIYGLQIKAGLYF